LLAALPTITTAHCYVLTIEKGQLLRCIDNKGFGFIKPENGISDIFIF
jgi:hypothetical protein